MYSWSPTGIPATTPVKAPTKKVLKNTCPQSAWSCLLQAASPGLQEVSRNAHRGIVDAAGPEARQGETHAG
jgi:hypothetical protein